MIKNLTPRLPEMGKIKAGTKGEEAVSSQGTKFRLPKKLNHYIITTTERDREGNLILDTELMETLKKSDRVIVDSDGNLTGIPIRLLYNDISLNFFSQYACYIGGKCVCSGDGEKAHTRDGRNIECPCDKLDPLYKGKDKCKGTGRLTCMIEGAKTFGGCHILRTTSINTISSILGSLKLYHHATSGLLSFVPFLLVLKPMSTTIPTTGQLMTIYVSSILYPGEAIDLKKEALAIAKEHSHLLLEMRKIEESALKMIDYSVESEEEQQEVQEEFFPEAIDVEYEEVVEDPEAETDKKEPPAEKKPAAKAKPKSEPKSSPKEPDKSEPEPEKDDKTPITKDQMRKIKALKTEKKITDVKVWQQLLDPFGVKTALKLTKIQADKFIEALQKNPT